MEKVAILGLGYVGLPLATAFAEKGFVTFGIDIDKDRIELLKQGRSYIEDVSDEQLKRCLRNFVPVTDYSVLDEADAAIICVPTPLRKTRDPDISYIITASEKVRDHLRPGMLVVLESTTYPGTTDEVLRPMLESTGLRVGRDFFLAFSPERIDPGNKQFTIHNTPKVIGGVTKACTERAIQLYSQVVSEIIPVKSAATAEWVKLLENTYRVVNIALVNELAILCRKMGVDIWEVIHAAATKPFGFAPFYPGPGTGGHCIPVDPLYLSWRARVFNFTTRFIELADEVNRRMPEHVVSLISEALNDQGKAIRGAKILILGVAYKKDVGDTRESPALAVIDLLQARGANLKYHDPHVRRFSSGSAEWQSIDLTAEALRETDCVVILADHSSYDWPWIVNQAPLIVDTRNATAGLDAHRIYRL